MKIIINADDLGLTKESNEGVVDAFHHHLVTQTTFIVNSPESQNGAMLAFQHGFQNKVGLHINLSEGYPLTEEIKKYPKYVKHGRFCYIPEFMQDENYTKSPLYTYVNVVNTPIFQKEIIVLRNELEAQILKFKSFGFSCEHIDSHSNQFVDFAVWLAIKPLLNKYQFKSIRGIFHSFYSDELYNQIYRTWLKNELHSTGLHCVDYISSIHKFMKYKHDIPHDSIIELYVHPIVINGCLIDNFTGGSSLKDTISKILPFHPFAYFDFDKIPTHLNQFDCR